MPTDPIFAQHYNDALDQLRLSLKLLNSPEGEQTGGKDEILAAAKRLHQESSKVGMWFTQNLVTSPDAARDLMKNVEQACYGLAMSVASLKGGAYLKSQLRPLASSAIEGLIEAVTLIRDDKLAQVARCIGKVWESCDAFPGAAFDDRTALVRGFAKVGNVIRDVQRELEEMRVAEDGASGSDRDEEGDDDSGSEMLNFEAEFSEGDMALVKAVKELVAGALWLVSRLMRELLKGPLDRPEDVAAAESCLDLTRKLQRDLEGLVAAIYPPIDSENEVRPALGAVQGRVDAICSAAAFLSREDQEASRSVMQEHILQVSAALVGAAAQ